MLIKARKFCWLRRDESFVISFLHCTVNGSFLNWICFSILFCLLAHLIKFTGDNFPIMLGRLVRTISPSSRAKLPTAQRRHAIQSQQRKITEIQIRFQQNHEFDGWAARNSSTFKKSNMKILTPFSMWTRDVSLMPLPRKFLIHREKRNSFINNWSLCQVDEQNWNFVCRCGWRERTRKKRNIIVV